MNKMIPIRNFVNYLKDHAIMKNRDTRKNSSDIASSNVESSDIASSDMVYTKSNPLSRLCSDALIASMIYLSSMNVMIASNKYLPDHNTRDTTIVASHIRELAKTSDTNKMTTADTSKIFAARTGMTDVTAITLDKGMMDVRTLAISRDITPAKLISPDTRSLDKVIASYANSDNYMFSDNDYYRMLRENEAFLEIKKYDIHTESTLMLVNKTFQKAMIIKMEKQPFIYSIDSLGSFTKQGRNFKISKNQPDKLVEMVLEPEIVSEFDCSTARVYGAKSFDGDAKTPEGIFSIYSVEDSHDWTFEGKWAYGPKFLRIKNAIGIHGNGTDNTNYSVSTTDKRYKEGEPLGVYSNNFAYGLSHGCIRLDNDVIYKLVNEGTLKNGTKIIIYENKDLTETLLKHYPASVSYTLKSNVSGTSSASYTSSTSR